jgi:hypothetical protein
LGGIWSGECARRTAPNTRGASYPGGVPVVKILADHELTTNYIDVV